MGAAQRAKHFGRSAGENGGRSYPGSLSGPPGLASPLCRREEEGEGQEERERLGGTRMSAAHAVTLPYQRGLVKAQSANYVSAY